MSSPAGRVRKLFCAKKLLTPEQSIANGALLTENDHILGVGGISGFTKEEELEIFEFPDGYITPGFIDIHIHGAGNFDCSRVESSPAPLESMSRMLASRGVTGFFPTVVSDTPEKMLKNLACLADSMGREMPGAIPLAINVEGPFLNPVKCGAQPVEMLQNIDLGFTRELLAAGKGLVKLMTFAPELPQADKLIEILCQNGVTPSMGHSCAKEQEALRAVDAGACHCTHLFNGMQPLHQRDIGLTGIALTDRRVNVELIIDGRHIHPRIVDLVCRCKWVSRLIGISDGIMAAGTDLNGQYSIGPTAIVVENDVPMDTKHTMAGSATMLDAGWHSLMSCGHLKETDAAQTVTINPAKIFHFDDRGVLLPGRMADFAVLEEGSNRVIMTVIHGKIVYRES